MAAQLAPTMPAPFCFALEPRTPHTGEVVEELERLFNAHADVCGEVFAIPRARIPVIKLVWTPTGTKVSPGAAK